MFTNKNYILAIYEEGSFSKAAKRLYVSQPSLSASVKRIEEKIGVPLFNRATTPVTLTEAGKQYIRYATEIKQKEHEFEKYISDYTNSLAGSVRIGGSSLFSSFVLPSMISKFKEKYPNVNFEIIEDSTKNLIEKLTQGTLDIIMDNSVINSDSVTATVCKDETLLLAVPRELAVNEKLKRCRLSARDIKAGKHLSSKYDVELSDFADCTFILLNTHNDTGRRANTLFRKYGLTPKSTFILDQQVTAYNISCIGMGICFVSDTLVRHTVSEPRLFYYTLRDEEVCRKIYLYKKNNQYLSAACQKFIDANVGR